MIIAPSILSADFSDLGNEIRKIDAAGCDWIHLDVMDGHFVPNLTFGPPLIKKIRPLTTKLFDVHLMVDKPEQLLLEYIRAGADLITIHYESTESIREIISTVHSAKKLIGLSIKPNTPVEMLLPYLADIDLVLIMSVEPGFGGQQFMPDMLTKIQLLHQWRYDSDSRYTYKIQIDGGITDENIALVKKAGTDVVVAGSFIFNSPDYQKQINLLK